MTNGQADEWARDLIARAELLVGSFSTLLQGSVSLGDIGHMLNSLVQAAESLWTGPGQGVQKRDGVKAALAALQEKYHWTDAIDRAIKLPGPLEWVDNMLLPILTGLIVDLVVSVLNATGAWSMAKQLQAGTIVQPHPAAGDA